MLKFNFINILYLTFLLYFFNFDLSFTPKLIFPQSTAVSLNYSRSDTKFFVWMTVKHDILKFPFSNFCFCKFTNNRGEINVCCDFFFDGKDEKINHTILCHRCAQINEIICSKLQFIKTAFSWCYSYWECQQNSQSEKRWDAIQLTSLEKVQEADCKRYSIRR